MNKIKELFDAVVAYCKAEPFHAVIVVGLIAFIAVILALLVVLSVKYAKAKKTMNAMASRAAPAAETEEVPSEKTQATEEAAKPVSQKKAFEEIPNVPAPVEETIDEESEEETEITPLPAEETAPVEEAPEAVEETSEESPEAEPEAISEASTTEEETSPVEEPVQEETEAPIAEEPAVAEETVEIKTQVRPIKKSEMKKEKTVATKKADGGKAEKNKNNNIESKEGTMLLDELKDINTDIDFYEEDEADRVARYSGKWVICRVVTNDAEDEEMYFFELHASNGEKLLSSEEYTTYNGAIRGIETHKANILRGNFRITLSKKGDYIFKLLNGKNMLLCMGEHYETKARCESAIESAKRFARTAFVDENVQDQVVKVPAEDNSPIEPLPDGYNGKWVIDCHTSPEGDKVFFFELFANNGERLLSSEEYTSYIGAINGIQTHKMNIKNGNFRISLTKHGDYIYKLLNGNGQLLCLGEHYKTKRRCQNAVESVKRFAANSPILTDPELTK